MKQKITYPKLVRNPSPSVQNIDNWRLSIWKTNTWLNLVSNQPYIEKMYLYGYIWSKYPIANYQTRRFSHIKWYLAVLFKTRFRLYGYNNSRLYESLQIWTAKPCVCYLMILLLHERKICKNNSKNICIIIR